MFRRFLVALHRCVTGKAPQCLGESLKTNSEAHGNRRTRGLNNLFLPSINSKFSFQFKSSQDWNSLPSGLKVVKSTSAFKTQLKDHIKQQYFIIDLYVLVSLSCCACVGINLYFVHIFVLVDFCTIIMQDSQEDQPLADEIFSAEN